MMWDCKNGKCFFTCQKLCGNWHSALDGIPYRGGLTTPWFTLQAGGMQQVNCGGPPLGLPLTRCTQIAISRRYCFFPPPPVPAVFVGETSIRELTWECCWNFKDNSSSVFAYTHRSRSACCYRMAPGISAPAFHLPVVPGSSGTKFFVDNMQLTVQPIKKGGHMPGF